MAIILNLTQHNATEDQKQVGVIDLTSDVKPRLSTLLTFDDLPDNYILTHRALAVADLVADYCLENNLGHGTEVLIGGAPFFMGHLTNALQDLGLVPLYAFSQRVVVESTDENGVVNKTAQFKHLGFVPA